MSETESDWTMNVPGDATGNALGDVAGDLSGELTGEPSPLAHAEWSYVMKPTLDDFSVDDWGLMYQQRSQYQREEQARHALRFLECSRTDASFGYPVNMYRHALQAATMALRDGLDEETIVVTLLHDIGFIACPKTHGEFAAHMLRPYISDQNFWMLERHGIFQDYHIQAGHELVDSNARERWRGHPHFEYTASWVERYDQTAQDARYECAPLSEFEPIVYRLFAREPVVRLPE